MNNKTYWDYQDEVERCTYCDEIIVDSFHVCDYETNIADDKNYSERLAYGFYLLDMED